MSVDVYVPLLTSVLLAALGPRLSRRLSPKVAAWALLSGAVVSAVCWAGSLALLASTGIGQIRLVATIGQWSRRALRAQAPVSGPGDRPAPERQRTRRLTGRADVPPREVLRRDRSAAGTGDPRPGPGRQTTAIALITALIVLMVAIPLLGSVLGRPAHRHGPVHRVHILRQCCDNRGRCRTARRRRHVCPPARRRNGTPH
ncbi:hypothetical protein ACFV1W_23085 [Kitasatospora sp. NPDC059648]|uniref:hypothetical protein n=1 Tax=Kitasatospora sp. NPDC059648 TaxID=3346894 RepID=UPI003676580B